MSKSHHLAVLEDVRHDIAALEQQLATLRAVEHYHATKAAEGTAEAASRTLRAAEQNGLGRVNEFAGMKMRKAAEMILQRSSKPLSTRQIVDALLAGGYEAKNPDGLRNTVFSMLDRGPELFKKVGRGEWALKESS